MRQLISALGILMLAACKPGTDAASEKMDQYASDFTLKTVLDDPAGDLSQASRQVAVDSLYARLGRLQAIDSTELPIQQKIDWKFAHSLLTGQLLELERMGFYQKDPRLYMRYTSVSGLLAEPGDLAEKIREAQARLSIVPQQLRNAKAQLSLYVPRFRELSLFMAENSLVLFDQEIPEFIRANGEAARVLEQPLAPARAAVVEFIAFLRDELSTRPAADFAIGRSTYDSMLRHQFLLPYTADSLLAFARSEFKRTLGELAQVAKKLDSATDWKQGIEIIRRQAPPPTRMMVSHQRWVDKAREHIIRNDLIPIPWKEKVSIVPRAVYLRKTSYYGNFSMAKDKDSDGSYSSEWMINPPEDSWTRPELEDYMLEHDWAVIVVTAPHETYGGHHVQGLYQLHNPSRIRRENSVSLFGEGWGLYNEQLMQETGFFPNEKVHLRQLQLRLWRIARVIYDIGMHTGTLSYEDAIRLMTDEVGFKRWSAQLEVDAATASPGYFIGYFTGMTEILRLREEFRKVRGDQFTYKEFHERLLKAGSMPPVLMRESLFAGMNENP